MLLIELLLHSIFDIFAVLVMETLFYSHAYLELYIPPAYSYVLLSLENFLL